MKIAKGICSRVISGVERQTVLDVVLRHEFWLKQSKYIAILLLSIAFLFIAPIVTPFEFGDFSSIATLGIYLMVFWAAYYTVKILATTEIEQAVVCTVRSELEKYNRDDLVHNSLNQLEQSLLPDSRMDPQPLCLEMFEKIFADARDHRFETSRGAVEPYKEILVSQLFDLKSVQTLGLRIGIIGTFVGLLIGLQSFENFSGVQIESTTQILMGALKLSFGTSIAGLLVSVFVAVFMMLVRSGHRNLFHSMENAAIRVISAASKAEFDDVVYTREMAGIREAINQQVEKSQYLTTEVEEASERIRPYVEKQSEILKDGVSQLLAGKSNFDQYMESLQKIFEHSRVLHLESISEFSEGISKFHAANKNIYEEMGSSLNERFDHVSASLDNTFSRFQEVNSQFIKDSTERLGETLKVLNGNLADNPSIAALEKFGGQLTSQEKAFGATVDELTATIQSIQGDIRHDNQKFQHLGESIDKLVEGFEERHNDVVTDMGRVLTESLDAPWKSLEEKADLQIQNSADQCQEIVSSIQTLQQSIETGVEQINSISMPRRSFGSKVFLGLLKLLLYLFLFVWLSWLVRPELQDIVFDLIR